MCKQKKREQNSEVLEHDVCDESPTHVQEVYRDCPYCIIDGAGANSPNLEDCRKVKDNDGMEQTVCKQKVWEQNSEVLESDVDDVETRND